MTGTDFALRDLT